jgi:hypothetical protein
MKGKVSLKTIIIFAILILVIVLSVLGVRVTKTFMSGATAGYEPQNLANVPSEDGKTATISWITDKSIKASIFYGTNMASLLLMAEDVEPTINHNILLTNLRSNTAYYYKIVVDSDNIFDNGGMMYSFKTNGTEEVLEPTVTVSPDVLLPEASSSGDMTSCNRTTDYNNDGIVNSMDYIACSKGSITPAPQDKCTNTDYNKDGVINSIDRIKCLQDSKL